MSRAGAGLWPAAHGPQDPHGLLPVSAGDDLQLTKNDRRGRGRNGDVRRVKGFDRDQLVLENGCRLDLDRAQHVRQGHTVTSQVSQSKEREKMFCLAMTSALPQINAAQALVSVSRAQSEARVYTDSIDSFEVKVQADTGHRQAALEFLDRRGKQAQQMDLQEHAIAPAHAKKRTRPGQEHGSHAPEYPPGVHHPPPRQGSEMEMEV